MCVCECVRERERERHGQRERKRERECVCVCKVIWELRRGGKGGGCKCWSSMVKVHRPAQLP